MPPQELSAIRNSGTRNRRVFFLPPTRSVAKAVAAITHRRSNGLRCSRPNDLAVVLTVTAKVEAVLALAVIDAGTEQLAPVGAPLQLRETVPPIPAPPMESIYDAVCPAVTVAEDELPVATPRFKLAATPSPPNATFCGLPGALSVKVNTPPRKPVPCGEKVTLTLQFPPGFNDAEQGLVAVYSPFTVVVTDKVSAALP